MSPRGGSLKHRLAKRPRARAAFAESTGTAWRLLTAAAMKSFTLALLLAAASLAFAGCASPDVEEDTETSEAAVTGVKLEKSRIEVWFDQKNEVSSVSGTCFIDSTKFRIVYKNPTLPAGTKVVLHVGESAGYQDYVGDGFGWGSWREAHWQAVRDVNMNASGAKWTTEIDGHPYTQNPTWPASGESTTYGASIQFVFRLELPSG